MSSHAYLALGLRVITVDGTDVQATHMQRHDPHIPMAELALVRRELAALNAQVKYTPGEKWCCHCGRVQRVNANPARSDFSPDKRAADGYHVYCKDCRRRYRRLNYQMQRQERKRELSESVT